MRAKRTTQTSLFDPQALDHPVADELEWASAWLDAHPELLDGVTADPDGGGGIEPGPSRPDPRDDSALRGAHASARRELPGTDIHATDSLSAQRFARLDPARRAPGKSVLQATVGAIGVNRGAHLTPIGTLTH